jgi:hypothetical protein
MPARHKHGDGIYPRCASAVSSKLQASASGPSLTSVRAASVFHDQREIDRQRVDGEVHTRVAMMVRWVTFF